MVHKGLRPIVKCFAFDPHAIALLTAMVAHSKGYGAFLSGLIVSEYERREAQRRALGEGDEGETATKTSNAVSVG